MRAARQPQHPSAGGRAAGPGTGPPRVEDMRTAGTVQVPPDNPPSPSALRRALARARDGKPIDQTEATVLLHARGEQLTELLGYAARTRDAGLVAAGRTGVITYSRKVFIPLTRLCRDRCGYCTFVTVPGRLGHGNEFLSPTRSSTSPGRAPHSAARRPCSRSATGQRRAGGRPGTGSTRTATTTRCPTCARWRSGCSRRPGCCRISTQAC